MSEPLIETLKERFPYEIVNPFDEVIIVPSKQFEHGWETILTDQGYKVFSYLYNEESSFFIRLKKSENNHEKPEFAYAPQTQTTAAVGFNTL